MMTYTTNKLHPGSEFPEISVTMRSDEQQVLGKAAKPNSWQVVLVYRGKHCPLCTKYLNALEHYLAPLAEIDVEVLAVSGDSKVQLEGHMEQLDISFPIAYGLTVEQMQQLGVYISDPRSPEETDHPFAEPGLFVVNGEGKLHVVDISNNPFVRPELGTLVNGLAWIKNPDNDYPIRGMRS
ncbi:redoxin domain-containing protein [Thalassotalea euphylliae]|uniref:Thioredoxin peroxidase n=1 Tax=Thalassotalea euphylliae TaxID=1655234 RepID=A0A3E0UGW1_9GAMM|nr:redoxin domain-containing protein [Thalassotalea euphylliae]REL34992.1 thioredoxin peroxidase [Thalassotalea euphylliae]